MKKLVWAYSLPVNAFTPTWHHVFVSFFMLRPDIGSVFYSSTYKVIQERALSYICVYDYTMCRAVIVCLIRQV